MSNLGVINEKCKLDDINCWKNQFKNTFQCEEGDKNCWKNLMPALPCSLNDPKCWK